ncbi:MAG: RNA polymerase sigma factor [Acidimicrobiales bacterium]
MRRTGAPVEQLTDEALLAGFGSGHEELAVAFVRRFQARVYGVALAVTGDRGTAEDVAQQAFERAWRHSGAFDPLRGSVAAWLTTIARNLALDAVRTRRAVPVDPGEILGRVVGPRMAPDPAAAAEAGDAAGALRAALRAIPPEQARAVVLAGVLGLTAAEVAAVEEVPLGTAKTRIRTAMQRLRAGLETAGTVRD